MVRNAGARAPLKVPHVLLIPSTFCEAVRVFLPLFLYNDNDAASLQATTRVRQDAHLKQARFMRGELFPEVDGRVFDEENTISDVLQATQQSTTGSPISHFVCAQDGGIVVMKECITVATVLDTLTRQQSDSTDPNPDSAHADPKEGPPNMDGQEANEVGVLEVAERQQKPEVKEEAEPTEDVGAVSDIDNEEGRSSGVPILTHAEQTDLSTDACVEGEQCMLDSFLAEFEDSNVPLTVNRPADPKESSPDMDEPEVTEVVVVVVVEETTSLSNVKEMVAKSEGIHCQPDAEGKTKCSPPEVTAPNTEPAEFCLESPEGATELPPSFDSPSGKVSARAGKGEVTSKTTAKVVFLTLTSLFCSSSPSPSGAPRQRFSAQGFCVEQCWAIFSIRSSSGYSSWRDTTTGGPGRGKCSCS